MPSAQPCRLTDDLWLAAHDSVNGRAWIGDWPLGVGLATGLLGELIHDRYLELRQGELFRTTNALPDDPARQPLLVKMASEERGWPQPTPPVPASAWGQQGWDWPPSGRDASDRSPPAPHGWSLRLAQDENRHRLRGHDLGAWMSYLAYEQRAENRVIDRLARAGLVRREQRRRVFGGAAVRYVPYDSVAGTPASVIKSAVQRGYELPASGLFLAGLFLATGLHHHALATLTPVERSLLSARLGRGLDVMSRELLQAADAAVGEAAMR
jgi:Golgi phosphoprotein 3 GPP34